MAGRSARTMLRVKPNTNAGGVWRGTNKKGYARYAYDRWCCMKPQAIIENQEAWGQESVMIDSKIYTLSTDYATPSKGASGSITMQSIVDDYMEIRRSGVNSATPRTFVFGISDQLEAQRFETVNARLEGRRAETMTHQYRCRNCAVSWWQAHRDHPECPKCKKRTVKRLNKR